jgi:hypothetical protein
MTAQAGRQLIDVHGHFVTDHYVAAAKAAGHLRPDGMPGWPSRDAATRVGLMDTGAVWPRRCCLSLRPALTSATTKPRVR